MVVISYSSLKGGTGKSSTTILTANCFAASGKKVLVIDSDINNSCSFYFLNDEQSIQQAERKNLAYALQDSNLLDFIIHTKNSNIDIIPSSLNLINLRAMSTNILSRLIPSLNNSYDVVLIDTAPTYDNIVLNCINASDYIITPVGYDQFNFNTSIFLAEKLRIETEKFDNWYLLFNGHESRYNKNPDSLQNQYKELFKNNSNIGNKILNVEIPFTRNVRKFVDTEEPVKQKGCTEKLYTAVCNFCSILIGEEIHPEKF